MSGFNFLGGTFEALFPLLPIKKDNLLFQRSSCEVCGLLDNRMRIIFRPLCQLIIVCQFPHLSLSWSSPAAAVVPIPPFFFLLLLFLLFHRLMAPFVSLYPHDDRGLLKIETIHPDYSVLITELEMQWGCRGPFH